MTDQEKTIIPFFGIVEYISIPLLLSIHVLPQLPPTHLLSSSFVVVIFSIVIPYLIRPIVFTP